MRLYLSSFRLGDHIHRLRELAGPSAKVGLVANAMDAEPEDRRREGVEREFGDLDSLGFDAVEVDLRAPGAAKALRDLDMLWVRGGNVLGPDLHGFEQVDDVNAVSEPIWTGLGLLDRPFVPHVDSAGHPETARCAGLSEDLTLKGTPHWAVRDREVLLVDSGVTELLSRTTPAE